MDTTLEIAAFEKKVKDAGLNVADVLREASIDRSMWTRWKNGTTVPRLDNWRSMERAYDALHVAPKQEQAGAA